MYKVKFVFYTIYIYCIVKITGIKNKIHEDSIVGTKYGKLQGRQLRSVSNRTTYHAFEAIPYAQPPVGDLRFRPPKPPKSWKGIRNAVGSSDACLQLIFGLFNQSEDCLYLNVYTPELAPESMMPVMVWIHGGLFLMGRSSMPKYGPDYLIDENVTVVTFNYRLGVFGFLSTEDEIAPGNYALKDQILALKWVKANIRYFGGDPDQITLFGESAGAVSVSYLLLSPLTEGLFHKAVMQSGTALSMWSLSRDPKKIAFAMGAILGISTNDSDTLLTGLRKVDAEQLRLLAMATDFLSTCSGNIRDGFHFAPTLEVPHEGAVVTSKSHELMKNGHFNQIPLLVGYNSAEANKFIDMFKVSLLYLLRYDVDPERLIPVDMNLVDPNLKAVVAEKIQDEFFGASFVSFSLEKLSYFTSSDMFIRPTNEFVKLSSARVPVYFYRFSYEGNLGNPDRTHPGVAHGEDVGYFWRKSYEDGHPTENDMRKQQQLVKLWTNFAKYSNPTPVRDVILDNVLWPPSDSVDLAFLSIDEQLSVSNNPDEETVQFWKSLYEEYGHAPYDTY